MEGGLRKHIVQLIEQLDQEEFDLYFIHGTKKMDHCFSDQYMQLKDRATFIPCPTFTRNVDVKNDYVTYRFLKQQMKEIQPDIVHCHSSKAGALGRIAAKRNRIEQVFYTPHAYSFLSSEFKQSKKTLFIWIEKMLSRYATKKTFNVSEEERMAGIKLHLDNPSKFIVIRNGLPAIDFPSKKTIKESLGLKESNIVIGNNARLSFQKDPFLFMEVAKEVIQQDPNYHFVWAGDGPLFKEVKAFLIKHDLTGNVHLLGERTDSERIVAGYDHYLITSRYEGLPYSLIEAIRAGVPIIGKKVTGVEEIRNLIRELGKTHTILLSSHILSEVSQVCKRVLIINKGKIVAMDTPENLEGKVKTDNILVLTVEDKQDHMKDLKKEIPEIKEIELKKENTDGTKQYTISSDEKVDIRKKLFEILPKKEITIFELKKAEATLEDAFIGLIDTPEEKQQEESKTEPEKENKKEKKKKDKKGRLP